MSNKSIVKVVEKNEAISVTLESVTFISPSFISPLRYVPLACYLVDFEMVTYSC